VEDAEQVRSKLIAASLGWLEALSPEDLFPLMPASVVGLPAKAAFLLLAMGGQAPFQVASEAAMAAAGPAPTGAGTATTASASPTTAAQRIAEALSSRPPLPDQAEYYDLPLPGPVIAAGQDRVDVHLLRSQGVLLGALAVLVPRHAPAPVLPPLVVRHAAIALSNALQFDELSTRSEGLSAITQLQSSVGLDLAFENVVARIITKLPTLLGASKAGVLLYDPSTQKLRLQTPAFGFYEGEVVDKYQVTVDTGGAAWAVFSTGRPYLGNDCYSDPCCRQEIVSLFDLSKMICVPLARAGKRIGVVIVANPTDRDFTEDDVEILDILSSHIGATLDNARLMEEAAKRAQQLERLHAITKEQHDDLQRILDMHLELNQRALAGTGIPGVAERLSRLIRRPLSVLDHFGSLVYRTPCTVDEEEILVQAEQEASQAGSAALAASDGAIGAVDAIHDGLRGNATPGGAGRQPEMAGGGRPAIIADISGGDQHLGYLVVISGDREMTQSEATTLEYARSMFALEMLKQRAVIEVERRLQGEFITDLLTGSADAMSLVERGYRFGHDLRTPHWVVGVIPADETTFTTELERIERCLARALPGSGVFPRGHGAVLLIAATTDKGRYRPPSLRTARTELERELGMRLLLGVGTLCTEVTDYPRAWREAELSVKLGSKVAPGRSEFSFRDLGVYRLLSTVEDEEVLRAFRDDALGPLIEHDRQHGDRLVETLAGFLGAGGVLKTAALNLRVHENTLRHRLDRIESVLGTDLASTGVRTELDLALKIHGTGTDSGFLSEG
jgi:sugar diacid utilization regulator/GAF domain-containing protein